MVNYQEARVKLANTQLNKLKSAVKNKTGTMLTHFQPIFHFYTPWKHQKTGGFFMFSVGIAMEHWLKMG